MVFCVSGFIFVLYLNVYLRYVQMLYQSIFGLVTLQTNNKHRVTSTIPIITSVSALLSNFHQTKSMVIDKINN